MLRLLARAGRGEPFVAGSVRLLRMLAVVILVYGVAIPFLPALMMAWSASADGSVAGVFSPFSLLPVVVGLLVAALAECFRVGTRLRDDVAGLV